ncbi:uncharacterized protein MONOS_788 [Monocercomonoides exilis]|uniref:uncharacterized protein n=1 Tax=Monocercomonoides exilis TaxID=2049356 RepID=UPI00355A4B22|nr:hypothetical protein MONOS_788 [Monocercomonoides exilis]|eukprot:MONOS_788.1-p1 / transcript=MONOS_788.1 / gene=MONOS_788 / organism=Monocercomonoides_exilis_PA203 / gene_product=unspecified product / transcript_product=unspecified product / location=Mono_scaffold00013:131667-132299(-) / protein_length=211 / sequence_SO=supercontig / SO=protein_coding / is_pseudo=false
MEEAKKADFRSKLSAEHRKWRQQEDQRRRRRRRRKTSFARCKLTLSTQGLHRQQLKGRGMGREEGGDIEDEYHQIFYSLVGTLSSARLYTQNITASSTFAAPPFSPLSHTQLSAPSDLVGTPPKLFTPSSPATYTSSLTQKSLKMSSPSSSSLSYMPSSSSPSFSTAKHSFIGFNRSQDISVNKSEESAKVGEIADSRRWWEFIFLVQME